MRPACLPLRDDIVDLPDIVRYPPVVNECRLGGVDMSSEGGLVYQERVVACGWLVIPRVASTIQYGVISLPLWDCRSLDRFCQEHAKEGTDGSKEPRLVGTRDTTFA